MSAIATDQVYIRNTRHQATLQSQTGEASVYCYLFDWKTPVRNGVLGSPHAIELPFVFGTTDAAVNFVGTGADLPAMTRMMIAAWSAFARSGDPNNPLLQNWPKFGLERQVMVLNGASHAQRDPGSQARQALDALPYYEYNIPMNFSQPSQRG